MMVKERKPLPLARAKSSGDKVPDASALKKLLEFKTLEAAEYLQQRLEEKLKTTGLVGAYQTVMAEVADFVSIIRAQTSTLSEYWSGNPNDAAVSLYKTFHATFGTKALEELRSKFSGQEIQFTFAMNRDSALRQGATKDGQALEQAAMDQINDAFSSFLVKNGMMCKDGIIYYSEDGAIKKAEDGQDKRVEPEIYKKTFEAFPAYVKAQSDVNIVVNDVSATVFPEMEASKGST